MGDHDGDGDTDVIYAYGARSFSIWDLHGALMFDSPEGLEFIPAAQSPNGKNLLAVAYEMTGTVQVLEVK